ncbi:MAG: hypothetical protein JSS94_04085 [Bacteroidetes bacterium]|nr:hypothetical protein [Bacteroidota bacterium]
MKNLILLFFISLFCTSCNTNTIWKQVKNGDLLFVEAKQNNLSGAISRVTKSEISKISFDHVLLVETKGNKKFALHASPKKGSEIVPLENIIKEYKQQGRKLALYRTKNSSCVDNAIQKAHTLIGKPYNDLYILNEESYYCSDFIERAYRDCHLFQLKAMTFKDPKTGKTDEYWENFYLQKGINVPEGQLGTNPNTMSQSENLQKIIID